MIREIFSHLSLTTIIKKKAHPCLGGSVLKCSSFVSCRIDPATWVSKTATYIARRKQLRQYVNVDWLFNLEKYGSSPSAKPPARSYWLISIVLPNLPNMFPLPGLARMYARDGVVTLRESPSTIYSLDLVLVLISRLPTHE